MKKTVYSIFALIIISLNIFANQTAVVAPEPLSAKIGNRILEKGGNAFDAAVAIGFALSVSYPRAGNIGGGGFAMIYKKGSEPIALDFREKAPKKAFEKMYLDKSGNIIQEKSTATIFSVGVPGTIKGLYELWEKLGSLPFSQLIEPAIKLAKNGVIINQTEADYIKKYEKPLKNDQGSSKIFFCGKTPLKQGDIYHRKNLAKTLQLISNKGEKTFYTGKLGKHFIKEVSKKKGIITEKDLQNYQVCWKTPIKFKFRNDTIYLMPSPSSGGIVISEILSMLENFDLKNIKHNSDLYIHILAEIEKRCYADRNTYLGDSNFFPINTEKLLSKAYLTKRTNEISLSKATPSTHVFPGFGKVSQSGLQLNESEETTSFAVLDKYGNCISITYTLNANYGCKITLPETGIMLNNEMDDFSSKPGTPNLFGLIGGIANKIEPEKRMLSSMTPTIVLNNGTLKMALGSPGGSTIITTVLQDFLNISLFNMDATEAVNSPRFHHQWLPDKINLEPKLFNNKPLIKKLENKGHLINEKQKIGNSIIILLNKGKVSASADKRGTGIAIISN